MDKAKIAMNRANKAKAITLPNECKKSAVKPKAVVIKYKVITTCLWLKPRSNNLKCKCWRSPIANLLPCQTRLNINQQTSKMGIPIISKAVAIFDPEIIASTPSINPMNTLPPSPTNIIA